MENQKKIQSDWLFSFYACLLGFVISQLWIMSQPAFCNFEQLFLTLLGFGGFALDYYFVCKKYSTKWLAFLLIALPISLLVNIVLPVEELEFMKKNFYLGYVLLQAPNIGLWWNSWRLRKSYLDKTIPILIK